MKAWQASMQAALRRMIVLLLPLLLPSADAWAYILHAGAGSVSNELEDVAINPANAAFINQSKFGLKLNFASQQTLKYRYPGSDAEVRRKNQVMDRSLGPDSLPFHYLAAPWSWLSLGLLVAPTFGIESEQKLERLPVVLLDSLDFVNITVRDIKVESFITGFLAIKASSAFGLGLSFRYLKASAKADIFSSGSGGYLTTADVKVRDIASQLGLRWAVIPRALEFGLVSNIVEQKAMDVSLVENLPIGIPLASSDASELTAQNPADHFTLGVHAALQQHHLYLDGEHQAAKKSQTAVSLHDFKVKERDVADTFAVRGAYALHWSRRWRLHLGAAYEPSSVGPGSQGANGKAGFGAVDMIPVVALDQFIAPYKEIVAGLSYHVTRAANGESKRRGEAFVVSIGYALRTASLGIDENGEQPAAYSMRRTWIPMSLSYTL